MERFKKSPDRQKEVIFLSELRQSTTLKRAIITSLILGSIGLLFYFALRKNSSDQSPETPSIEKVEKKTQRSIKAFTSSANKVPNDKKKLMYEKIATALSQLGHNPPARSRLDPTNFLILQELAEAHHLVKHCFHLIERADKDDLLTNEQWKEINLIIEKIITAEGETEFEEAEQECNFYMMSKHYDAQPRIKIKLALRDGYISEEVASNLYDLIGNKTREEALDFLEKSIPDQSILDNTLNWVSELVGRGYVLQSEWEALLAIPQGTVEEIQAKLKVGKELGNVFGAQTREEHIRRWEKIDPDRLLPF
ncbi:hypothetical protein KKA33_01650 [Patescibacteria group bacterium]|nr:hypothetical protein [Patescibacteria group bacterium]